MPVSAKRLCFVLGAVVVTTVLAACGGDEGDEATTSPVGGEGATVNVLLSEFIVDPSPASVSAHQVAFVAKNEGKEKHELVIVKTDLAPDKLPTKDDGSVDEEAAGVTVIDEIEEFDPGGTEQLSVKLDSGKYVLLCNIVDEEGHPHYKKGMHAAFSVQ